jgi:hypothetical protein
MATPPPPPPPPPAAAAAIPAPSGGSRTVLIVLCVLGGLFLLIGGCVGACSYYAAKKAKAYAASASKNPQFAAVALAASVHPDIQVVSKNEDAGQITLRNKKTGEVVKLDLNAYSAENIGRTMEQFARGLKPAVAEASGAAPVSADVASAEPVPEVASARPVADEPANDSGREKISPARIAAMEGMLRKFPAYVEKYPRSETVEVTLNSFGGFSTGSYSFFSSDKPDAIVEHYEKKITAAGFAVLSKNSDTNDYGSTSTLISQSGEGGTFSITAESEKGGVRTTVNFVRK